jgi:hypothetical protein
MTMRILIAKGGHASTAFLNFEKKCKKAAKQKKKSGEPKRGHKKKKSWHGRRFR